MVKGEKGREESEARETTRKKVIRCSRDLTLHIRRLLGVVVL